MKIKRVSQDCPHTVRKIDQTETRHAGRATQATVYAGRSPFIGEDGYWYEWSDSEQGYINTGTKAEPESVEVVPAQTTGAAVGSVNGVMLYTPTTTDATKDGTTPITSGGVYTIVGNIDVLLSKI